MGIAVVLTDYSTYTNFNINSINTDADIGISIIDIRNRNLSQQVSR